MIQMVQQSSHFLLQLPYNVTSDIIRGFKSTVGAPPFQFDIKHRGILFRADISTLDQHQEHAVYKMHKDNDGCSVM